MKEKSTDGRTGMDNAKIFINGDYPNPNVNSYASFGGVGGISSLQNKKVDGNNKKTENMGDL